MATRNISVYIDGKLVRRRGGYDKVSMKNMFKHYLLDSWSSYQCDSWMRNYGTTELVWCGDKCRVYKRRTTVC